MNRLVPRRFRTTWRHGRLALLGLMVSVAGCYPGEGATNVQDLDVVLTIHDEDADFASYRTFAMPDTVLHIVGEGEDSNVIELPRTFDDLILDLVTSNMASLGYIREPDPENNAADLILLVGAVGVERTTYWYGGGCYWYCWGWWPGWGGYPGYGPGWGWGYPPYVGSTKFEQGAILLTLIDPNGDTGENEVVPVIWGAGTSGLLSGSGSGGTRITNAINQAFAQSPYLGR